VVREMFERRDRRVHALARVEATDAQELAAPRLRGMGREELAIDAGGSNHVAGEGPAGVAGVTENHVGDEHPLERQVEGQSCRNSK
jgi:hypothetical protein